MERELLRLILNYRFYNENKHKILREMFPRDFQPIYKIINEAHEKYKKDLTVGEIKALYTTTYPTTTRAKLTLLEEVLDNLPQEISEDVAKEIIQKAWIIEVGRQIAGVGIDLVNQKTADFTQVRTLIEKIEQGRFSDGDDLVQVSNELEDILNAINTSTKWDFYLEPLKKVCSGIGPGIFSVIAARVETGKSAFLTSICAAPGGLAEQGARIAFFCNEEPAQRTQGRAVMCFTGMNLQEILINPEEAKRRYATIKDKLKFYECRGKTVDEIERFIIRNSFDVSVFDMLDKLSLTGSFNREDERLGSIYEKVRNIGVRSECAILGSSQLNAEAEGKVFISSANLANARTSKAAEADLLIGLGKMPGHEENTRILNIVKNKITGNHQDVVCILKPEISRYVA